MWQKLNRIDSYQLAKIRIQLVNAIQLVSAAPRSYLSHNFKSKIDWLLWNAEDNTLFTSYFGTKEKVKVSLDMERFVISIFGKKDHIEHLVLSGMTYPMAYGWMKIKLEAFHFNGNKYNDETSYAIEKSLIPDEEMNLIDQSVVHDLTIYYSNAYHLFDQLKNELNLPGKILVNPMNLNLELIIEDEENKFSFGFAPGNTDYPEPFFFFQFQHVQDRISSLVNNAIGIWNTKNWNGLAFLSSEFLTLDPTIEKERVSEFFKLNFVRLFHV